MHDENHHKDPLERLFYKKATEYEIPFREEDWLSLEKRLDIIDLQRSYRNKFLYLAAASILIFALFGYFTFDNYNRLNQLTDQLEMESFPETEFNQPVDRLPPSTQLSRPAVSSIDETSSIKESASTITASDLDPIDTHSVENDAQLFASISIGHRTIETELINPSYGDTHYLLNRHELNTAIIPNGQQHFDQSINLYFADHHPAYSSQTFNSTTDHLKTSRFGIGFVGSPDKTSSGISSNYGKTGYRIGIKGEYRITDNLYLTAGILASNIQYATSGSRYNPPEYWNNGVKPDNISAICMILDIPLGIKYNMINFERSRFFATAGFSSYIMLSEDYRFDYDTGYNGLETNLIVNNGSRHLLNNINLSLGYELDLFPNWNVRAEPFINIPVSGVGWGDVKLYSIGSYVSINYQL